MLVAFSIFWFMGSEERAQHRLQVDEQHRVEGIEHVRQSISQVLGPYLSHNQLLPEAEIAIDGDLQQVKINYTIDQDLQAESEKLLKAYKPDFGALVILDANTGAVRAMASVEEGKPATDNLTLRGTYPAASVFKIVTATAALDRYKL